MCDQLAHDPETTVRVALAANLHHVAALLSHEECLEHLKRQVHAPDATHHVWQPKASACVIVGSWSNPPEIHLLWLHRPLLALLVDTSPLVIAVLLERLAAVMQAFQGADGVQSSQLTGELLPPLLRIYKGSYGWRCMEGLMAAVPVLVQV